MFFILPFTISKTPSPRAGENAVRTVALVDRPARHLHT